VDLFDALTHKLVAENITDVGRFTIVAQGAALIVVIPHGAAISKENSQYMCNGTVIAYQ